MINYSLAIGVLIGFFFSLIIRLIAAWIKDVNYRLEVMRCDRKNIYDRLCELEKEKQK
jgi:peptidoglycan biosynthesis protein MviN/MurJ (putative lipid II flippase)